MTAFTESELSEQRTLLNIMASREAVAGDAAARARLLKSDPIDTANQAHDDLSPSLIESGWDKLEWLIFEWQSFLCFLVAVALASSLALIGWAWLVSA